MTIGAERLSADPEQLKDFCRRWKVVELALFGSVLREDFDATSDVDVLVRWEPGAKWGLLDQAQMEEELSRIFGRRVDLLSWRAVEASPNWVLRRSILETAKALHVAR